MKKTLIALAAVAATGAAFAQSSVTLYGILDIGYGKDTGAKFQQKAQFHTPSRFGLKGTEDLGGGMKANFDLQSGGMDLENGASSGLNFTREAWVGLSGGFGSTRIGRTSSVATQGQAGFDFNGISTSSAMALAGISPVTWYGSSRRNSQLQYTTNNMGGFDAGLGVVLSGDNSNKSTTQLRANYNAGPLAVGFTTESARTAANRTAFALAGSYNLGAAKIGAGYVRSETVGVTYTATGGSNGGKGVYLNAVAPVGATNLGIQFARNSESKDKVVELFAVHSLSKRTALYFDLASQNYSSAAKKDMTRYALGVQHSF